MSAKWMSSLENHFRKILHLLQNKKVHIKCIYIFSMFKKEKKYSYPGSMHHASSSHAIFDPFVMTLSSIESYFGAQWAGIRRQQNP